MRIGLALRELHRSESSLARDLLKVSDRHKVETEVHHVAGDLARWSAEHVRLLAEAARGYDLKLDPDVPRSSGPLAAIRTTISELGVHRAEPGLVLLADLRRLHRKAVGVSLDWELLAQGAQAIRDTNLVDITQKCHPRTLRQMKWANAMLKTLSPQVLVS
ncbi:hypothetical protein GCM10029964_051770 [Kibdelosporangium lantanae]